MAQSSKLPLGVCLRRCTALTEPTTAVTQHGLIQGTGGNLYGTTAGSWCDYACGTIFTLTTSGTFTNLYIFCPQSSCADTPSAPLVQDTNGTFYGTTGGDGATSYGTVFSLDMGPDRSCAS